MNIYLRWVLIHAAIITMLLSGNDGLEFVAVAALWWTAFMGCILAIPDVSSGLWKAMQEKQTADSKPLRLTSKYLNVPFDICLGLYIAYIGMPILSIFYLIHIIGMINIYNLQQGKEI